MSARDVVLEQISAERERLRLRMDALVDVQIVVAHCAPELVELSEILHEVQCSLHDEPVVDPHAFCLWHKERHPSWSGEPLAHAHWLRKAAEEASRPHGPGLNKTLADYRLLRDRVKGILA